MENTWDKIYNKNIEEKRVDNKGLYSAHLNNFKIIDGVTLDLGTGFGEDAVYLSDRNISYATDYSKVAIDFNKSLFPYVNWSVHDTTKPFIFEDNKFDFINAFLSLHYFSYEQLDSIFAEIKRISKPISDMVYTIKLQEENDCNTGKVFVSEDEHMFLIEKHFNAYKSEVKEELYCGNTCKLLYFYVHL